MTQATNTVAAKKPATLEVRLLNAQALVARLIAEIEAKNKAVPNKGDIVSFDFGRGDKKVQLSGKVLAISAGDNGVTYVSVLVNEDTNPEVKRVPVKDVTAVRTGVQLVEVLEPGTAEHAAELAATTCATNATIVDPLADHDAAVAELLGE